MGLFSSSKEYTLQTSTSRIIEDDRLADTLQRALFDGLIGGQGVATSLINAIPSSVGRRVDKMFKYIKSDYPEGLMRSRITSNRGQLGTIRSQVEADTGHTGLEILYAQVTALNFNHLAYEVLVEDHAYNPVSNEVAGLSASLGGQVFLEDFLVLVPQDVYEDAEAAGTTQPFDQGPSSGYTPERKATALSSFAIAPDTLVSDDRSDVVVIVEWLRRAPDGSLNRGTFEVPLTTPDSDMDVFQVKYRYKGHLHYWSYTHQSGHNDVLDGLYEVPTSQPATLMPVVYFRRDHTDLSHKNRSDSTEHQAATEALDILGINYQEMGEAIHDNPDIDDVRNAFVMFGASPTSPDPTVRRYLYEFFDDLVREASGLDAAQGSAFGYGVVGQLNKEDTGRLTVRMRPSNEIGRYQIGADMTFSARSVGSRLKGGVLGEVGSFHTTTTNSHYSYTVRVRGHSEEGGFVYRQAQRYRSFRVLLIRKQVTKSTYHEIQINDPTLSHRLDHKGRSAHNKLGEDGDGLLIPIDYERVKRWNTRDKEVLLQRSLHIVFNVYDVQKVRWYQTGAFQVVMVIAAIVIAVFTGQFQAIALALATMSVSALAWAFVVQVVKLLAMQYAFKVIAEEVGGEFALYLAVAMAVYSIGSSIKAGSLDGAPWAEEMLVAANGLSDAAANQFEADLEGLANEYDDLLGIEEEREAELERARSLLNTNNHMLDPMNFILGESPDDFYQRTIHSGNIGALGFDAIHNYVDASLHLPGT